MPKQKTHKSSAKRVKITAKGGLRRENAGGTHFQQKKSGSRKRAIAAGSSIRGAIARNIKRAMGK